MQVELMHIVGMCSFVADEDAQIVLEQEPSWSENGGEGIEAPGYSVRGFLLFFHGDMVRVVEIGDRSKDGEHGQPCHRSPFYRAPVVLPHKWSR
jgi:hypothetical protein